MLKDNHAFSGFSVKDLEEAKRFYSATLGVDTTQDNMGLHLNIPGNSPIFVYQKDDHEPATFTILNFIVDNIDASIAKMTDKGVVFEPYDFGGGAKTDEKGVLRGRSANMGPDIAWFKDPSGNVLSIVQE